MCQAITDMRRDAAVAGERQKAREVVITMLKMGGFSLDTMARIAGLTIAEVEAIRAEIGA